MCKTMDKIREKGLLIRHIRSIDGRVFGSIVHTKPNDNGVVYLGTAVKHPKKDYKTMNSVKIAYIRLLTAMETDKSKVVGSNIITRTTAKEIPMYGDMLFDEVKEICYAFRSGYKDKVTIKSLEKTDAVD